MIEDEDERQNKVQLRLKMTDTTWFGFRCIEVVPVSGGLKTRVSRRGKVVSVFYPSSTFTKAEWQAD